MSNLKKKYNEKVKPNLGKELGIKNVMNIPKVSKVIVNFGMGIVDKDKLKKLTNQLALITGQKPVVIKAKKSISNFKLREGMPIGAKVTLRGDKMYEFIERLTCVALPRIRDFRGVSGTAFDGRGNYTLGIKEQSIFPEIDPNDIDDMQGMDITFVTTAKNDKEAYKLLELLGMPFAGNK